MDAIIERIEGGTIILELDGGEKISFAREYLPGAREGNVVTFYINEEKTELRKKQIEQRVNKLWKD